MAYSDAYKARAAALGLTPYQYRVQRAQQLHPGTTRAQAEGHAGRAHQRPIVGRRTPRVTNTPAGRIFRSTSARAILGELRRARDAGQLIAYRATYEGAHGYRTVSSGGSTGGGGPLVSNRPAGPAQILTGPAVTGRGAVDPRDLIAAIYERRADGDDWDDAIWDALADEFYEEEY